MEIGHAIPVILGLVGLTGAVVLALFSRLKRGVMYGRALDAIADWAGEQQQQARQARDEHSASASLPRFKIIDSSKCFAYCTGLLRARLVVSRGLLASLSPAQLDAVLIHEQAHATRYDNLRLLLTTISLWPLPRSWSYALMRDLTSTAETVCDRKAAKRLGNVETVIDAISILSRARSATIKRSGSGFTHQSTVNEDAIELRIRALRRGPEDRLSDLALAGFALGAYAAIVMPSTYLAHHVVESVLGWLS
jgi:beta-lactamase regulating signal transducer with metallopeptidase domain